MWSTFGFSQTIITGKISEKESGKSLPGSSIYVKNSFIGTVANKNGEFKIVVPGKNATGKLCISSIGFKSKTLNIQGIASHLNVALVQDTALLNEVIVMPKDTLLALLRRAYGKIKDNYYDVPTMLKGFYRETFYMPETDDYLYFGEAIFDVYKTSYKNNSEGQVRVVDSRMNKHPLYDTICRFMWYGGVHYPLYRDHVKRRKDFISPVNFKHYTYSISKSSIDSKPAYKIRFSPINNNVGRFKGEFYLDIESLAYLYFDYSLSHRFIGQGSFIYT